MINIRFSCHNQHKITFQVTQLELEIHNIMAKVTVIVH